MEPNAADLMRTSIWPGRRIVSPVGAARARPSIQKPRPRSRSSGHDGDRPSGDLHQAGSDRPHPPVSAARRGANDDRVDAQFVGDPDDLGEWITGSLEERDLQPEAWRL